MAIKDELDGVIKPLIATNQKKIKFIPQIQITDVGLACQTNHAPRTINQTKKLSLQVMHACNQIYETY